MDFQTAIRTCFQKYATFEGRATRPEFWWWVLFTILIGLAANIIDVYALGTTEDQFQLLSALVSLGILLPNLAVTARRLHDIGRSGWWMLIVLIPILGFLILLYWCVQPGKD